MAGTWIRHDIDGTPLRVYVPLDPTDPWRITASHADDATWIAKPDELELSPDLLGELFREVGAHMLRQLKPPTPATVPSMDDVPVWITGRPDLPPMFGVPTVAAEPETERWRK